MIRDPVQRAFSSYIHLFKRDKPLDLRSFDQIVSTISRRSEKGKPLELTEDEVLRNAIQDELISADHFGKGYLRERLDVSFDSNFEDPLWPYRYFAESQYSKKINKIRNVFDKSTVKIVVFERLINSPNRVINEVFKFLNLNIESEKILSLPHKNETTLPRGQLARSLMRLRKQMAVVDRVWRYLEVHAEPIVRCIRSITKKPKPTLSKETYNSARVLLKNEYEYWAQHKTFTNSFWRRH
ncbi:hypothetical protein GGP94_001838 [Salinibacter ruber]|nr:hypothetical protein [Salinibacter ruber]